MPSTFARSVPSAGDSEFCSWRTSPPNAKPSGPPGSWNSSRETLKSANASSERPYECTSGASAAVSKSQPSSDPFAPTRMRSNSFATSNERGMSVVR